jgi:WD40 repeat protein
LTTSRDGKLLATTGTNTSIRIWDTGTGKDLHGERGHTGPIDQVAFAPDGESIFTSGSDGTVRMWDLTGREVRRLDGIGYQTRFSLSSDGGLLAAASTFVGKEIRLWAPATGKEVGRIDDFQGSLGFFDLSADGQRVAASGSSALQDPVLRVWDVATKRELFHIDQPGRSGTSGDQVEFMPDGRHLVSTFGDGTLRFWNPATGEESLRMIFEDRVGSFTIDPSGQLLAVEFEWAPTNRRLKSQQERTCSLVETATGQEVLRIPGRGAFSPDGKLIAISQHRGDVTLCCTATGRQLLTLPGHGWLTSVAFSPDGRQLATAGADCSALVWDLGSFTIAAGALAKDYTENELRQLWTELQADKASTAYQAAAALVASPDQAVTLLKQHLRPAEPVKEPDVFEQQPLPGLGPRGEALRTLRALRILEQIGTEQAREVLESLAHGQAEARSTRAAKAALARLSKRIGVR